MPRTRSLKPSFFTDSELTLFSPLHRIAFEGLWVWADKRGTLEDKPRELKVQILPFDDCDFDAILTDLCRPKSDGSHGFIRRYQVNGKRYIHIRKFLSHQKPHIKETRFEHIPDPPPEEPVPSPGRAGARPDPAPGQSAGSLVLGSGSLVLGAGIPVPRPAAPPEPVRTPVAKRPDAKPKAPNRSLAFFAWAQDERLVARPGLIPEYPNDKYEAWYSEAIDHVGGDEERLRAAWRWYLGDKFGATREPPFAMRVFQSPECWVKHVPEMATAPPKPKPSKLNRPAAPATQGEEIPF